MNIKLCIGKISLLSALLGFCTVTTICQIVQPDDFGSFIQDLSSRMPAAGSGIYKSPTENDLSQWGYILRLFKNNSLDSCRIILSEYNYQLIQLKDAIANNVYDIIEEKEPISYGWGTYIFNRNHKKRLYVHINHPLDDPHALIIGTELFRKLKGEWLMIAGTSKRAVPNKNIADMGRSKNSVYERWHEMLSNLTYVTLSLHSYDENQYQFPINNTEIIISNGSTTDKQWGISQISLAIRDTIKNMGYTCGLAMYDSGYSRLAGGWNIQGTFSNDSVGFGHWIYIELSKRVRERLSEYSKLFTVFDRSLDLTSRKISQQVNHGFGLVSPRVIRIDSTRQLLFPSESKESFRFISYDAKNKKRDTFDIKVANWFESLRSNKNLTSLTILDTNIKDFKFAWKRSGANAKLSKVTGTPHRISPTLELEESKLRDSSSLEEDENQLREPLQVHRIPLRPVFENTIDNRVQTDITLFKWGGIVPGWFTPNTTGFEMSDMQIESDEINRPPKFFIPIINSSYQSEKTKFLGVQMTKILLSEIARLVYEYNIEDKEFGLIAEEMQNGSYCLRIFPNLVQERENTTDR